MEELEDKYVYSPDDLSTIRSNIEELFEEQGHLERVTDRTSTQLDTYVQLWSDKLEELMSQLAELEKNAISTVVPVDEAKLRQITIRVDAVQRDMRESALKTVTLAEITKSHDEELDKITHEHYQLLSDVQHNKDFIESLALDNADTTTIAPMTPRPGRPYKIFTRLIENVHMESARNFSNIADQWHEMSARILSLEKTVCVTSTMMVS